VRSLARSGLAVRGLSLARANVPPRNGRTRLPIQLKTGDVIDGKYKVAEFLGAGGMGAVVKATALAGGKIVALKYCFENSPDLLRRFAREVRIMQGITHRHVVQILDANLTHKPPYFTMPLAVGSLQDEIPSLMADEDAALDAFLQLCQGAQAIHNSLGVHRDIKPLNALRYADDTIVISDLGLAKYDPRDTTTLTQASVLLGTRAYCAPEQLMPAGSRDADGRTDIYQLGKTLYEILTGKSPALIDRSALPAGLAHIVQRSTAVHEGRPGGAISESWRIDRRDWLLPSLKRSASQPARCF
jgi:eukaryotic-like serine/threonine-protein kinase